MPLIETLPESLEKQIGENGHRDKLVAAVSTDLLQDGSFGEEWFVLDDQKIRVFTQNGVGLKVRVDLSLAELKFASAENLIGGGSLHARMDGKTVEVLRYSNTQQSKFTRIARYLTDYAKYKRAQTLPKNYEGRHAWKRKDPPGLDEDPEAVQRCPNCKFILPEGSKVCPSCVSKSKVLKRILMYLKPHWKKIAAITALMLVGVCMSLVPPFLTQHLVDDVLLGKTITTTEGRLSLLMTLVLTLLATQIVGVFLGIFRGRIAAELGTQLSHELRTQLFQHLQLLGLKFFDKRQTGSIMARVTRDTQSLQIVLVDGIQGFVSNILLFIGIGAVLFYKNWQLTLLVFIPAPVVVLLSALFWKKIHSIWHRCWSSHSLMTAVTADSITGIRVVRAFAKEGAEVDRFNVRSDALCSAEVTAGKMWNTFFPVLFFIMGTGNLLVWYLGGRDVIRGDFTPGILLAFISYLNMFYGPLQWMSNLVDYLSRSLTAAERVFEILDHDPDVKDASKAIEIPHLKGTVEFHDVSFGYDKHKYVLKNMTFKVEPGEMIGLVGKSGAGKSTTINLICRFYDASEGLIKIDGHPIKDIRQQDLRSQIGVVLQDTLLFSGTIADNIAYARPGAPLEDVMAAAKAANAHDFIVQKPDGYDTQVGERGQSLSGGERQRVAIARAILHNPRILILDEATSSVDTETEKQIQEALARLVKGRTTIAIAHRLSTLRKANKLLVLKDGEVAEMGTHEELLKRQGEFHKLVQVQQEMNKIMELA